MIMILAMIVTVGCRQERDPGDVVCSCSVWSVCWLLRRQRTGRCQHSTWDILRSWSWCTILYDGHSYGCTITIYHVMSAPYFIVTHLGSFSTMSQCLHLLSNNLYSGNKQKKMKNMMRMIIQIIMETIASPGQSCDKKRFILCFVLLNFYCSCL